MAQLMSNYVGKVSGDVVANPNIARHGALNTFLAIGQGSEPINGDVFNGYFRITQLDGKNLSAGNTSTNGYMAQHLFSFNVIEILERAYGRDIWQGRTLLADKVVIARQLVRKIRYSWHGFGSANGTNKASTKVWVGSWVGTTNHTNGTVTEIQNVFDFVAFPSDVNTIGNDGFFHLLAYSEAVSSSASVISTDYIEIELTSLVGTVKKQWHKNFVGKVAGSVVENPNIAKYASNNVLSNPNLFTNEATGSFAYDRFSTLNGTLGGYSTIINGNYAIELFSFNIIELLERRYGHGIWQGKITLADKIAIAKKVVKNYTFNHHGYGSSVGGNGLTIARWRTDSSAWYGQISNPNSAVTLRSIVGNNTDVGVQVDTNGFIHFIAYTTVASDGVTPSIVNTDYVEIEVTTVYDTFTSTTSNNFVGKLAGSLVENPNISQWYTYNILIPNPTVLNQEINQTEYDNLKTLNGVSTPLSSLTTTYIAQNLFSFNIIEILERKYGKAIWEGASTLAEKVAKARLILRTAVVKWYGHGSSPTGSKAVLNGWGTGGGAWLELGNHTASTPTKVEFQMTFPANDTYLRSDGFVYFLANAEASNGTVASVIYTDYIELILTVTSPSTGAFVQHLRNCYPNYNVGGIYPDSRSGADNMRIVFYGIPSTKTGIELHPDVDLQPYQLQNRWFKNLTNPNPIIFTE